MGGKSTGVAVKMIIAGGVADNDGRLKIGDHLLHICQWSVRGMSSEQVAFVLRKAGSHIRLVVARSISESSEVARNPPYSEAVPIERLEEHLHQLYALGLTESFTNDSQGFQTPEKQKEDYESPIKDYTNATFHKELKDKEQIFTPPTLHKTQQTIESMPVETVFDVDLVKDESGLGIKIAGLVGFSANEKLCGIYVRHVLDGSAAALDGRVQPHDRIVEVNGQSLEGFTNAQAVEVLKSTGKMVTMKLARLNIREDSEGNKENSSKSLNVNQDKIDPRKDDNDNQLPIEANPEDELVRNWENRLNCPKGEIIIAHVSKFRDGGGLGVGLEGTVDIEDGVEVRPHHYIRSILKEGPVGQDGILMQGDELLQVNDEILFGKNYKNVLSILKKLPLNVRIVCRRKAFVTSEKLFKAKSEACLVMDRHYPVARWRSVEPLTAVTVWNKAVTEVTLPKTNKGLGFSMIDYEDPLKPGDWIVIVRSLVPGGVAQADGRVLPGDRIVSVNDISLQNGRVSDAVKALKEAPPGQTRIGLIKPLSPNSPESSMDDISENYEHIEFGEFVNICTDTSSIISNEVVVSGSTKSLEQSAEFNSLLRDANNSTAEPCLSSQSPTTQENQPSTLHASTSTTSIKRQIDQALFFNDPIRITIHRKDDESLGLNIVGGKMDSEIFPNELKSGIFVKQVAECGPAAGQLKKGDQILEVDGQDIRNARHEQAVEAIKFAKSPITLLVRSIGQGKEENEGNKETDDLTESLDNLQFADFFQATPLVNSDSCQASKYDEKIELQDIKSKILDD
ncbi:DgyrCDS1559 [Dimorphilus gyrociliatus]|nr:DgyrCDS1559 [Dimorphilus gyrociliatus]